MGVGNDSLDKPVDIGNSREGEENLIRYQMNKGRFDDANNGPNPYKQATTPLLNQNSLENNQLNNQFLLIGVVLIAVILLAK